MFVCICVCTYISSPWKSMSSQFRDVWSTQKAEQRICLFLKFLEEL